MLLAVTTAANGAAVAVAGAVVAVGVAVFPLAAMQSKQHR